MAEQASSEKNWLDCGPYWVQVASDGQKWVAGPTIETLIRPGDVEGFCVELNKAVSLSNNPQVSEPCSTCGRCEAQVGIAKPCTDPTCKYFQRQALAATPEVSEGSEAAGPQAKANVLGVFYIEWVNDGCRIWDVSFGPDGTWDESNQVIGEGPTLAAALRSVHINDASNCNCSPECIEARAHEAAAGIENEPLALSEQSEGVATSNPIPEGEGP